MVATPIGNLKDITLRALEVLSAADVIYCEDTRVSQKLLAAYGVERKLLVYNDHSTERDRQAILRKIEQGQAVALISDAGTPVVSDPGYKLVREIVAAGLPMTTIPGASALTAAMALCGLPTDQVLFTGFLPPKSGARRKALQALNVENITLFAYERASRLQGTIEDVQAVFGDVECAILRELTKRYEEVIRGTSSELVQRNALNGLKGEIVLAVYITERRATASEEVRERLQRCLSTHRVKDAVNIVAEETGKPKRELYQLALEIQGHEG